MDSNWLLGDDKQDFFPADQPNQPKRTGTITLQGNLFNTNLAELFLTITNSQMSGALYVTQGKKEKILVFSEQGLGIKSNSACTPRPYFGETLVKMGRIGMEHMSYALSIQPKEKKLLGQILVSLNYIKAEDIEAVLKYQIRSELLELFQWQRAEFQFYQGQEESEHPEILQQLQDVIFDTRRYVIDLADKFQTLSRVKNLGTLRIQGQKDGKEQTLLLHFGSTQFSSRSIGSRTQLFGTRLLQMGLVTSPQLENALQIQKQAILNSSQSEHMESQLHLGQILFEQGIVTQEQIKSVLFDQIEADFTEALSWENIGYFYHPEERFDVFSEQDHNLTNIPFDPFSFAIKAFTISTRWVEIYKIIPNAREILPIKSGFIIDVNNIRLDHSLDQIKSAINRKFDLKTIQEMVPDLSGYELAIALMHLIRDSIEEIVDELRQLSKLYHINSIFSKEAKTLELITVFLPKDMEAKIQLAETFEKIDPVYSAQLYLQLSQYHSEPEKIKNYLSKAASLDPNNPEVTRYMIHGLVRTGEHEMAIQSGKEFFYSLVDSKQMEQAENLANYFIQAGVGVEDFHRLCIETYEKQGNLQRTIREYEMLIRYFRKVGDQKGEEAAHKKVVELEDKILSLSVRKETRKIGSNKKSFPFVKFLMLFLFIVGGGYGGLLYIQSQQTDPNHNNNGISAEETEKLRQKAMLDIEKLVIDLEDLQGKELFDRVPFKCKELTQIVQVLDAERRSKYETLAKNYEETSKKQEKLLQEDRDKLTKIDKQESASIELFKEFIASTPFHRLKNEATISLEVLERREVEGQEEKEKFLKFIEQQKYKEAFFQIQTLKKDSLLRNTKAVAQLKYFKVIHVLPFAIKIKYASQDFGKTPYIVYLDTPESFNQELLETEPGFSPLVPVKENPLTSKDDPWIQTFEVSRKEIWTFRGDGSFLAPAFINKTNNAVALGDTSGIFYVILGGNEAYRFAIGKGLDKDIRAPCFSIDDKYIFVSANKTIYCIDPENTKNSGLLWQSKLGAAVDGLSYDDKNVYAFDSGKGLRAFSMKNGEEIPFKPYPTGKSTHPPILVENEIFCVVEEKEKQKLHLIVYELNGKKIKMEQSFGDLFVGTVGKIHIKADQKRIIVTNRSGRIISYFYSLKRTGSPLTFPNTILDPLFLEEEMLVACQDGHIYSYDYKPDKQWDMKIFTADQQKFTSSPIVKGDYIFVAVDDNRVYAIHRPSKTIAWYYSAKEKINALQIHGNWLILSGDKAKGDQLIVLDLSGT